MRQLVRVELFRSCHDRDQVVHVAVRIALCGQAWAVLPITVNDELVLESADGKQKDCCEFVLMRSIQGILVIPSVPRASDVD